MKALAVTDKEKLELQTIEIPQPNEKEVLIKVAYVGICGSDIPRYFNGSVHQFPQVLGHEFSGVITEIGKKVTSLAVGDKVAVAPLVPCGECAQCQLGRPQLCDSYSFIGSRQQGAMAEYLTAPAQNCLRVPATVSLKAAATIEPLTVAIHGIEQIQIRAGSKALVLGAGTIGLMTVLALRAKGAGQITVVDINPHKLKKALEIGADRVIDPLETDTDQYFSSENLAEIVFETAGSSVTQVQAIKYAGRKGKVVFIGTSTQAVQLSTEEFELILRRELTIKGSWMSYSAPFPGFEWTAALAYLASGKINTLPLITSMYQLEDQAIPFEKMHAVGTNEIKVMYEIGGEMKK